jgi:DNA-directed RNA polymerase subunit N (RpoN/RPB10)
MLCSDCSVPIPDLTKEVKDAIDKGRELISRGAPAELLVASMAEQYPMMAMYAEEMVLTKQGITHFCCVHSFLSALDNNSVQA